MIFIQHNTAIGKGAIDGQHDNEILVQSILKFLNIFAKIPFSVSYTSGKCQITFQTFILPYLVLHKLHVEPNDTS